MFSFNVIKVALCTFKMYLLYEFSLILFLLKYDKLDATHNHLSN